MSDVLGRRLAGQRVTAPAATLADVAAGWFLQDSPPGAAALAAAARVRGGIEPGAVERALEDRTLVALYNARTATAVVPAAEAGVYTTAQLPRTETALRFVLGRAVPKAGEGTGAQEAVELTGEAMREALDGGPLSRDELHEALRRRLPEDLLPWCDGCKSHHARRNLLVLACLRGELCLAGRAGRQPAFARPDRWLAEPPERPDPDAAAAELARRFLRAYGPATEADLAAWAGVHRSHAKHALGLIAGELAEADGGLVLADDAAAPPPAHAGVTLLPPGDPLLQGRDRERLVADEGHRRTLWRAINAPGAVLSDGTIAGAWRARKRGATLELTVERFGAPIDAAALERAAAAVAAHRGCRDAVVS